MPEADRINVIVFAVVDNSPKPVGIIIAIKQCLDYGNVDYFNSAALFTYLPGEC